MKNSCNAVEMSRGPQGEKIYQVFEDKRTDSWYSKNYSVISNIIRSLEMYIMQKQNEARIVLYKMHLHFKMPST